MTKQKAYPVVASHSQVEIEVKKSRFICDAFPVGSRGEAMDALAHSKGTFPDARHHCWAYLIGSTYAPETMASSDDGEPSGTAGKPILNVIQHKDIGSIMLIVTRYFGGIKLGASGLIKAYSAAASSVYAGLTIQEKKPVVCALIDASYNFEQPLRRWLTGNGGELIDVRYTDSVLFSVRYEPANHQALMRFIKAHGYKMIENTS